MHRSYWPAAVHCRRLQWPRYPCLSIDANFVDIIWIMIVWDPACMYIHLLYIQLVMQTLAGWANMWLTCTYCEGQFYYSECEMVYILTQVLACDIFLPGVVMSLVFCCIDEVQLTVCVLRQACVYLIMLIEQCYPVDCFAFTECRHSRSGQVLPSAIADCIRRKGIKFIIVLSTAVWLLNT